MTGSAIISIFVILLLSPKTIGQWLGTVQHYKEKRREELFRKLGG